MPAEADHSGVSYQKMAQPASGFAIVGAAVRLRKPNGAVSRARVGITGLGPKAFRALEAERAMEKTGDPRRAAEAVADGVEALSDLHASAEYRRHLARVFTARAFEQALARAS